MNKSFFKKIVAGAMAFGIIATAFGSQSFAATDATISGGEFKGGEITFAPLTATLNGSQVTAPANWKIGDITDARGTGEGWALSMSLEQFKEHDGQAYVTDGKTLHTGSLKITSSPVVTQKDITSSPVETITPIAVDQVLDGVGSVKLLTAERDGGMGSYTVSDLGVELTIPANAYAKTYKTEATVTLTTAP